MENDTKTLQLFDIKVIFADLDKEGLLKSDLDNHIIVYPDGALKYYAYDTLAELNAEWEDYVPKEPLIKDEKIRKAVRAWADVNRDTRIYYNRPTNEICVEDKKGYVIRSIKFKFEFKETIGLESGEYTIAELCGEEEDE